MGQKLRHLLLSHLTWMVFSVKQNETPDPAYISLLRAEAKVFTPQNIAHLVQQFGIARWRGPG